MNNRGFSPAAVIVYLKVKLEEHLKWGAIRWCHPHKREDGRVGGEGATMATFSLYLSLLFNEAETGLIRLLD